MKCLIAVFVIVSLSLVSAEMQASKFDLVNQRHDLPDDQYPDPDYSLQIPSDSSMITTTSTSKPANTVSAKQITTTTNPRKPSDLSVKRDDNFTSTQRDLPKQSQDSHHKHDILSPKTEDSKYKQDYLNSRSENLPPKFEPLPKSHHDSSPKHENLNNKHEVSYLRSDKFLNNGDNLNFDRSQSKQDKPKKQLPYPFIYKLDQQGSNNEAQQSHGK